MIFKRSVRGSTLVVALLMISVLLVSGLGFLNQRRSQYEMAQKAGLQSAARALAEAGIEDFKAKLQRHVAFPPVAGEEQKAFEYIEPLENSAGEVIGTYEVSVDYRYITSPFRVYLVRSTGRLGDIADPDATRTLEIEVDIHEETHTGTYFEVVNWRDLGGS